MVSDVAAGIFGLLVLSLIVFQVALAAGVPWGELAMGGRWPGQLPAGMRIAAMVQAVVLLLLALAVFVKAGFLLPRLYVFSQKAVWGVVLFSLVALTMNLLTPSRRERMLWAPVAFLMTLCSIVVALE